MKDYFEDTPLSVAKEILSKAIILTAQSSLTDEERNFLRVSEEAKKILMHMMGRHFGELIMPHQRELIKEKHLPEEFRTRFTATAVVLTYDEYQTLLSAIDTIQRKEEFEKTVDFR